MITFFAELSYQGEYLLNGAWQPIGDLDRRATAVMAKKVARSGMVTNTLLYSRHYVHNFVFKPNG